MKPRKQIWVVSDGIPGHFNQSRGVVTVLQRHYDCEVHWVEMILRSGIFRRLLRALLNATRTPLPASWLKCFYRFDALPEGRPDLLVAAGGKASFALAWLARALAVPSVFSGSLRGLQARHFGLILSIEPRHAGPNTLIVDVAPMPVDLDAQRQAGAALRAQLGLGAQPLWLLLIGGDGAGFHFAAEDWHRLAAEATELARSQGLRWLVSTSRRTGAEAEAVLREQLPAELVADAVWWDSEPRRVLQSYLGAADVVCCTADSLSMLTEAVVSGKPVIAWAPRQARPDEDYRAALQRLEARHLITCADTLIQGAALLADRPLGTFDRRPLEERLRALCESSAT